ncbi:lytic murein transglycosylase [Agaribacterium sp. ZY112]|uniref:lytic murein transglycosylase n=1 Tax=Agaribacterium sp. ZY112 TaxID=3233574 RepID=UPI0035244119
MEQHKAELPISDYMRFSELFLVREDALILVAQLNQLLKAVQRHRGISMGMLAGNTEFKREFLTLQRQLERRLATLEAFAKANQLLSARDKENLSLAWATIRSNWEGDDLNDNFELHSHFIEQLLVMIASLARELESPLVDISQVKLGTGAFSPERYAQQGDIIKFVCKTLPQTIEQVARIRGTAAYAAAVMSTEGLDERKLRFWVNSLKEHAAQLASQSETLRVKLAAVFPSLVLIKKNESQLLQFLAAVEATVFSAKGGRDEAHQLFNVATDVIEVYWDVVADGLAAVQRWHRADLEAWVALG